MYTVVYVRVCALYVLVCVRVRVCVRVCIRVCEQVCVLACACEGIEELKTPFLLVSFLPKRGPASKLFVPLRGGLGGFPGLSPFLLKID